MNPIDEIREKRIKKLKKISDNGFSCYPISTGRTNQISEILANFSSFEKSQKEVVLVGRIKAIRAHGGLTFLHFEDGGGRLQAMLSKNSLGEKNYKFFLDNFDIGDFVEFRGSLFETKKKEKTIKVSNYKIIAKSLRPLPEKWHGLKDVEERYRKRYLDLIFNPEVKSKFETRSKIVKEIRNFLENEGFLEVETPILQPIYGGASARPFKTHLNALNIDMYLRIAPELYLKRLLVGGFEKIYEIGRCFRNEGVDKAHNPDFTMLEFYWAYADYKDLMKLTEKMFLFILKKIFGQLKIKYNGKEIDFTPPFKRVEYLDLLKKEANIDYEDLNVEGLKEKAKKMGIKIEKGESKAQVADKIFKKFCQPKLWQPTFLIHFPTDAKPLAKSLEKNKKRSASFQLLVGQMELVNAYSELNNPLEQKERFKEQEKIYKLGLEEAQRMDNDFIEALEYGMPLAAGFGMGIDRLVSLLTDSHSLREVILFPTMKPKKS